MFFSGSVKIEQPGSQPTPVSSELVPGAQNELIGRLQYPTFLPSDFTVSFTMFFWSYENYTPCTESIRSSSWNYTVYENIRSSKIKRIQDRILYHLIQILSTTELFWTSEMTNSRSKTGESYPQLSSWWAQCQFDCHKSRQIISGE